MEDAGGPGDTATMGETTGETTTAGTDAATAEGARRYRRALEGLLGIPATEGNEIEVLRNGDRIFPAMLDAIRSSTSTIDFLTFVYWEGTIGEEFAAALSDRARCGVRVRVLLDALGAKSMDRTLIDRMSESGCEVEWFRPVNPLRVWETNHRTHRKVLICDEAVGFTGGVGIADEWRGDARNEHEWRDTHFRIRGPAVDGLRAAFVDNWAETGNELFDLDVDRFPQQPQCGSSTVQVVRGAAETGWSDISTLVRALLGLARRRVRITTAYFVPDERTLDLVVATAERGVEIDLLLPGPGADKRFCQMASEREYETLLEAGVRIWNFKPSMLHAKVLTVDGLVADVGSANLNARSLTLDEEVNFVVFDPGVVAELDRHFDEDVARSEPIDPKRWRKRGLAQRTLEAGTAVLRRHI